MRFGVVRLTPWSSGSGMRPSSATDSRKSRDHLVLRNSMTPLFSPANVQELSHRGSMNCRRCEERMYALAAQTLNCCS